VSRALFLDRDGIIDDLVFYPSTNEWESPRTLADLHVIEDSFAPLVRAAGAGWLLFIITNQPSYAKGKATKDDLLDVHDTVMGILSEHAVPITKSYLCLHHPQGTVSEYAVACECRKPGILFLREAAREFDVDLADSWMVGDQDTDLACGRAAGCKVALIEYPHSANKRGTITPDLRCHDLDEFVSHLLGERASGPQSPGVSPGDVRRSGETPDRGGRDARSPSVTVSMITMNEEKAVAKVVNDIRRVAPDAEILLVDSSRDRTAEIAESLGCRVIRQFPPQGYGPAMNRAVREASGDVVVTLDCDDTYPVEMIPKLVRMVEEGWDLVNTTRVKRRPKAMPLANFFANRIFALTARLLHGIRTTDVHSGMRAYRKSMIDAITWSEKGPALPVDMLLIPYRRGYRVTDVEIDYRERIGQTTLHRWSSTIWTFRRIWRARRYGP
jgi:histidinol-phosphate phosphatase family protein